MKKNILCLRDSKRGAPKHPSLRGKKIFFLSPTKTRPIHSSIPKKTTYDYGLITSANALCFCKSLPQVKSFIFIGEASYQKSIQLFPNIRKKSVILRESDRQGVLNFFKKQTARGKIFFPRSKRADQWLPQKLRAIGYGVCVRHTYDTIDLSIRKSLVSLIERKNIEELFFTSPSGVQSVFSQISAKRLKGLGIRKFLSIGQTTKNELKNYL